MLVGDLIVILITTKLINVIDRHTVAIMHF